jgi:hypothetical protein
MILSHVKGADRRQVRNCRKGGPNETGRRAYSTRRSRSFPAVSEGMGIRDFVKRRVKFAKLAADTLDGCSNVCAISMLPRPSNEAVVVLKVVDRAVQPIATDVRHQQMNDVVFGDGEADVELVPIGPMAVRPENKLTADDGRVGPGVCGSLLAKCGHQPKTHGQKLHAACFVDKAERTALESEFLVRQLDMARQEHHRQVHSAPAQFWKQVDARNIRKFPVEHDDIGLGGGIERPEQGVAIGEAVDSKAMPRQLVTNDFAVVLVIFDDKDTDGIRLALLGVARQAGRGKALQVV